MLIRLATIGVISRRVGGRKAIKGGLKDPKRAFLPPPLKTSPFSRPTPPIPRKTLGKSGVPQLRRCPRLAIVRANESRD
jgi:hypothetical protein